jgi:hypothetical protein
MSVGPEGFGNSAQEEGMDGALCSLDISSERRVVALVDQHRVVLIKPKPFSQAASGYQRFGTARVATRLSIATEAAGH